MLNKAYQFNNRGFTLIEAVVAISVLIVGLLGVFIVVQDITFSSRLNASRLTATYLVQEGIELMRNKRDSNWLHNIDWASELSGKTDGLLQKFTREINISDGTNGQKIITVTVSWQDKGKDYSVRAVTELYKWWK